MSINSFILSCELDSTVGIAMRNAKVTHGIIHAGILSISCLISHPVFV